MTPEQRPGAGPRGPTGQIGGGKPPPIVKPPGALDKVTKVFTDMASKYPGAARGVSVAASKFPLVTYPAAGASIGRDVASAAYELGTPNPDFKNLPSKFKSYPDVKQLFDDDLKNLQLEDSLGYIKNLINICADDDLAISQSASFSSNYSKTYIFNSNNLEISGKETNCTLFSEIIIKDKITKEISSGNEFQSERMLKNINVEMIGRKALMNAKRNLNRKKIKSMKIPLILTPRGTISLILKPIATAVNGETFQYKRCFLFDKRDEILGSEYLNIEDNGLIDGATGSSIFDGEGVPCKNKKIFDKGKFLKNGLLHNSFTAGKEGIESTGNASRNSYASIPSIGITNFIMKQGDTSFEEIIKDTKKGIILDYTGVSPNI